MTTPFNDAEAAADERRLELSGYEAHLRREVAAVEVLEQIQAASVALQSAADELAALGEAYRKSRGVAR
jgi:hypothetical protein